MLRALTVAILALGLGSCESGDPDTELRALIEAAEAAAEERDTGFFRRLISENYIDERGRRKQDLVDSIRGYLFVNANIELLNRIDEIQLSGTDAAEITLQSAMIGRREGRSVLGTNANLWRIDLELVREDGDWRIIGAQWERILQ